MHEGKVFACQVTAGRLRGRSGGRPCRGALADARADPRHAERRRQPEGHLQ